MARLVLIRHAKAADGRVDIARPLAPRGRKDARAIGQFLEGSGIELNRVVVSPALRARQTWDAAQRLLPVTPPLVIDDRIYGAAIDGLTSVIHDTPDGVHALALVGHNPSIAELAAELDDAEGDSAARRMMLDGFSTSAVAVFEVLSRWGDVVPHSATLRAFAVPRG